MAFQIGKLGYYQAQAGVGSSFGPSFGQQSFGQANEDKNIFATNQIGITEGSASVNGGINTARVEALHRPVEGSGLVSRLDKMDQSIIKPEHKDELHAQKLDLFA